MKEYKCPFFEVMWKVVEGLPLMDAFCGKFGYEDVYKVEGDNKQGYRNKYDIGCDMVVAGNLVYCSRRRAMGDSYLGRLGDLNPEPIEKAELALREKFHEMEMKLEGS